MNNFTYHILNEVAGYYTTLINEAKSVADLVTSFQKNNQNIDTEELTALLLADPTSVQNDRGQFVGKYATWIANQYIKGNIKQGDIPELQGALTTYNINKSQIPAPGINACETLHDLIQLILPYDDRFKAAPTASKASAYIEKVFENELFKILIPHTWEASRKIGGDTRWCTASSDGGEMFNYYLNEYGGEYYDIIRKSDGAKFQLHPESNQFMDREDDPVNFASVCSTISEFEPLEKLFAERGKDISRWTPKVFFDEVDGLLSQGVNPKYIFDRIGEFNNGIAHVQLNRRYNFINSDGHIVFPQWLRRIGNFSEGFAYIKLNGKYNFINTDLQLLFPNKWFDDAYTFKDGFAPVALNKKYNFINSEGQLLSPDLWFDFAYEFNNGIAQVKLGKKYNYINREGQILSPDKWFDVIDSFYNGIARVKSDDKYNYINREFQLLSPDLWFDEAGGFKDGITVVKLKGKPYLLNREGQLYDSVTKQPIDSEERIISEVVNKVLKQYLK